eukprot:7487777-Pyramimonas_sp.AAC.1
MSDAMLCVARAALHARSTSSGWLAGVRTSLAWTCEAMGGEARVAQILARRRCRGGRNFDAAVG